MKYVLPLLLSGLLAMGGENTDTVIVNRFYELYQCNRGELLPELKIQFLSFASITDRRQSWHAIRSDADCIQQIYYNALPRHFTQRQSQQWLMRFTTDMLIIKKGKRQ